MKIIIAFAAVLSSAALTVPTVTDVGHSKSADARQLASLTADESVDNVA